MSANSEDVITISDDEEEDQNEDNSDESQSNDSSDDIQIIEEIQKRSDPPTIWDINRQIDSDSDPFETRRQINEESEIEVETKEVDNEVKSESPNKKRIIATTLSSVASTSSAANNSEDASTHPPPKKVKRTTSPTNGGSDPPKPSTSEPKLDSETLLQNYLKAFKDTMSDLKVDDNIIEELSTKLSDVFTKLKAKDNKFLNSNQFQKLMKTFTLEICEMSEDSRAITHHNDLIRELHRLTQPSKKSATIKVKNKSKQIEKLTETIKKLQKQIYILEHEELDLDSLQTDNSFTKLPKLYRKVDEVWAKREELLKRSTNTGRILFKKFKFDGTYYPDINKVVENYFNNYMKKLKNKSTKGYIDESFTFIDVRKVINDEIAAKKLEISNCDALVQDVYKQLMNELKQRRQKDSEDVFETLETLDDLRPDDFDPTVYSDPKVNIEIAKNKSKYDILMNKLFEKYTLEDKKNNGDSILTDGQSEWESTAIVEDNDKFESLDVKDGDLDGEDVSDEENSEEEIEEIKRSIDTTIPNFETKENAMPTLDEEPEIINLEELPNLPLLEQTSNVNVVEPPNSSLSEQTMNGTVVEPSNTLLPAQTTCVNVVEPPNSSLPEDTITATVVEPSVSPLPQQMTVSSDESFNNCAKDVEKLKELISI